MGRKAGVEGTLRKLINLKFGDIPESASKCLEQATDEQLDTWIEQILAANSLDDLFTSDLFTEGDDRTSLELEPALTTMRLLTRKSKPWSVPGFPRPGVPNNEDAELIARAEARMLP